jgi:hypothetical protein
VISRIAGSLLLSLVVFVVVSLLGSLGVLWLTGVVRGVVIGVVCGLGAAFVVGAASTAGRRTESTSRGETDENNSGLQGRHTGDPDPEQNDKQRTDPEERPR